MRQVGDTAVHGFAKQVSSSTLSRTMSESFLSGLYSQSFSIAPAPMAGSSEPGSLNLQAMSLKVVRKVSS